MSTRRSRVRRWLVVIALTLVLLVGGGVVFLRVRFSGPALADTLCSMMNEQMRGKIRVRSIDWATSDLTKVVTGGWVPLTMHDVEVWWSDDWNKDPVGKEIVNVKTITAELDIHALMFGRHDLVFRNVVLDTGDVILEEIPEPYPLHAYDTTVFSLIAAFYEDRKPGFHFGVTAGAPAVFDIQDFTLKNIDLQLAMDSTVEEQNGVSVITDHGFTADCKNVNGKGFLYADASDPLVPKLYFSVPSNADDQGHPLPLTADSAEIVAFDEYKVHLEHVELTRLAQLPTRWPRDPIANTLDFGLRGVSSQGATIALDAKMLDYWDSPYGGNWDATLTVQNAGTLAHDVLWYGLGGDHLTITGRITGPIRYPKFTANLKNAEAEVEIRQEMDPLKLYLDNVDAEFDKATDTGVIEGAIGRVKQKGGDGQVKLSANLGINPFYSDAQIEIPRDKPVDLSMFLPDPVPKVLGGMTWGSFHARGDSDYTVQVDGLDAHVGLAHIDGGTIFAKKKLTDFSLVGVRASAGDTSVKADGGYQTGPGTYGFTVDVDSGDVDRWMTRLGLPPLAKSAHGRHLVIADTGNGLTAHGELTAGGVAYVDDLDVRAHFGGHLLTIDDATSHTLGEIRGHGTVDTDSQIVHASGTAHGVDLHRLPVVGPMLGGTASGDVAVSGPVGRLHVDGAVQSDDVSLLGQRAKKLRACLNRDPASPQCQEAVALAGDEAKQCTADSRKGGQCLIVGIDRDGGGAATVVARTDAHDHLAGHVAVDDLPLDAIGAMAGQKQLPAGGTAALAIDLGGTLRAPSAEGTLGLLRTWVYGAFLGDQSFRIRPATSDDPAAECADPPPDRAPTNGKFALCGSLQDGRVVIAAVLGTRGTMPIRARVDLHRVEIDPFLDVAKLIGAPVAMRAWTSGTITVDTELARADAPLSMQLEMPEVAIVVPSDDDAGRPSPLVIRTKDSTPLSVHFDGKAFTLGRPVTFVTPAGELTLAGSATPSALALAVQGNLDLGELSPLLATWFDDVAGKAAVDAKIAGTFAAPQITAKLGVTNLLLRPVGQDTTLAVAKADLDLTPEHGLAINPFDVVVSDSSSGEQATLSVHGGLQLDGLTPKSWGVIVDGELAGKMLQAFAPEELAEASGVAGLHLDVIKRVGSATTSIDGDIDFDPPDDHAQRRPLVLMPRGLRRELILTGGSVSFTEKAIKLEKVKGSIDDEGLISNLSGKIALRDGKPTQAHLSLDADGIPFRIPHELDLVLGASPLTVDWDADRDDNGDGIPDLRIAGNVAIVQGRYEKDFNFGDLLIPSSSDGTATPVWDAYPALGAAQLGIDIDARSLMVDDNIANIELAGHVNLIGTPKDPRLDGEIRILRGTFSPGFTRVSFTRTSGSASFSHTGRFPDESPVLNVTSETENYRDTAGQDHVVVLTLSGSLSHLTWDLTTKEGFNKAETLALIVTGRAPEDVTRKSSDILATDTSNVPTTTDTGGAADQVIKDVAGNAISLLVGDPLHNVHLLDVERLEVGPGSIGFHGERKVISNANVIGDVEQTVRGRTVDVRVEIKSTFGMALQLGYLDKNYDDPAEQDVKDFAAKLTYRIVVP